MTELLTTAEVAARLRMHPKTVERAIRAGRLRAARLSGTDHGPYGIAPEWVDDWVNGSVVVAVPATGSLPPMPASGVKQPSGTLPLTPDMGRDRKAA